MMEKSLSNPLQRLIEPYKGLGASLWSMFFATMINRFGDFVGVFLTFYLSRTLGYAPVEAGSVLATVMAASTIGAFLSGRIADQIGRKRCLMACQTLAAATNLAMSFLYGQGWSPALIVAGSFFRGGARPLIGAVLTDLSPQGRRKEVFGLQYWSINVGVALGPLVASFLFENALDWLFRGDALCTLASVALIWRGVSAPPRALASTNLEAPDERGAIRAFLARPILVVFGAIAILSTTTYSQTGFGLPLSLAPLGKEGSAAMGYLMSLNATLVIALSIPIARLLRKWSPLSCMALSGIFYVVGFGMLAWPLPLPGILVSTAIWTLGEIITAVNMGVFLAKHSPANWRASFQSFTGVFYQAGSAVGPLVGGALVQASGLPLLWGATAGLCLVWGIGAFFLDRWDRRIVSG